MVSNQIPSLVSFNFFVIFAFHQKKKINHAHNLLMKVNVPHTLSHFHAAYKFDSAFIFYDMPWNHIISAQVYSSKALT